MIDLGMDVELQKAIVAVLRADATLMGLIGERLYEDVPPNPDYPYVTIGQTQEVDDSVEYLTSSTIYVDVHVWTTTKGYKECKRICSHIRALVHDKPLVLAEERLVTILHRVSRVFPDGDTVTKHGVVTFNALTEEE